MPPLYRKILIALVIFVSGYFVGQISHKESTLNDRLNTQTKRDNQTGIYEGEYQVMADTDTTPSVNTSTTEWWSDEMVTVPRQWQSRPDHPTTTLAYITAVEMKLLKKLDLHDSGIDVEDHFGPGGVPSLNGTDGVVGTGNNNSSNNSGGGASHPGTGGGDTGVGFDGSTGTHSGSGDGGSTSGNSGGGGANSSGSPDDRQENNDSNSQNTPDTSDNKDKNDSQKNNNSHSNDNDHNDSNDSSGNNNSNSQNTPDTSDNRQDNNNSGGGANSSKSPDDKQDNNNDQKDTELDPQGSKNKNGLIDYISDIINNTFDKIFTVGEGVYDSAKNIIASQKPKLTFGPSFESTKTTPHIANDPELSFNLQKIPNDILFPKTFINGEFPISYSAEDNYIQPTDQIYIEAGQNSGYYSVYTPLDLKKGMSYEEGLRELQQEAAKSNGEVYAFYIRRADNTGFWWTHSEDLGELSVIINFEKLLTDKPNELNDPLTTVVFAHTHPDANFNHTNIPPSIGDLAAIDSMNRNNTFGEANAVGVVVTSTGGWVFSSNDHVGIDSDNLQSFLLGNEETINDSHTNDVIDEILNLESIYACNYTSNCNNITALEKAEAKEQLLKIYKENGFYVIPYN